MRRFSRGLLSVSSLLMAAACSSGDRVMAPRTRTGPESVISDAVHEGGTAGFYFLPPMVAQPTFSGTFDADITTLNPAIAICDVTNGPDSNCGSTGGTPAVLVFTTTSTPAITVDLTTPQYQVNWDTQAASFVAGHTYRVHVTAGASGSRRELGFADVLLTTTPGQAIQVETGDIIVLKDGRTLPIHFRIETGIPGSLTVSAATASVTPGGTDLITATVRDLHGALLAGATVAWSVATTPTSGVADATQPLTPTSGQTGTAGTTATTFKAGTTSGTATVTARSAGLSVTASVTATVAWQQTLNADARFLTVTSAGGVFASACFSGVFRSTDDGGSWASVGLSGVCIAPLAFSPTSNSVFAGSINGGNPTTFRSTDNGSTWSAVGPGNPAVFSLVATSHGTVLEGTTSGIFRSTDNGSTWSGVGCCVPSSFAITSTGYIFAGTPGGVYRSTDDGATWTLVGLANTTVYSIATTSSDHLFAGTATGIFRSTDGVTWTQVNSLTNIVTSFAVNSAGEVFAGVSGGGVLGSTDDGATWTQLNTGLTDLQVRALAISSSGRIFAATPSGVFRTVQ